MQVKNDYLLEWQVLSRYNIPIDSGKGVFNGDTGVIKSIDNAGRILTVEFDEKRQVDYEFSSLDELELAYAVTVHKSQGSGFKNVMIVMPTKDVPLLTRELLYTAITRAEQKVLLCTGRGILLKSLKTKTLRYSGMPERLKENK